MSPARIRKCGLPSSRVAFAELFDPSTDMQVYGSITDAAVQTMRELGGPVPLIVKQRGVGGFTRSSAEAPPVA